MIAPPVTLADLKDFTWGDFGKPITHDQFLTLVKEPPIQEITVNDSIAPFQVFGKQLSADGLTASVQIEGNLGVNMFLQHVVSVESEHGVMHVATFKVIRNENGHNVLRSLTLSFDNPQGVGQDNSTLGLEYLDKLSVGGKWQISISILKKGSDKYSNPVMQDLEGKNPIRLNFMEGIIDEQTGSTPLNVTNILPV